MEFKDLLSGFIRLHVLHHAAAGRLLKVLNIGPIALGGTGRGAFG
jgi:hypothetical protein